MTDTIKVTLNEGGPDKKIVDRGYCLISPNIRFSDGSDGLIIGRITARGLFSRQASPSVDLLPCDLVGPQNADGSPAWHYNITYSTDTPGKPRPWSFTLLSTNGAEQKLSDLMPPPPAPPLPPNPTPWNMSIAQGSKVERTFTFTAPDGITPYDASSAIWEYVLRDQQNAQVFTFRTTPTVDGSITVQSTEDVTQLLFTLFPSATAALAPGNYSHALWMNPDGASAYVWLAGVLEVTFAPQP